MEKYNKILERFNQLSSPTYRRELFEDKYYTVDNAEIAAQLESNIKSEAEAREKYYVLIESMKGISKQDVAVIEEIIGDELNHTERLNELLKKYSKIPAAED